MRLTAKYFDEPELDAWKMPSNSALIGHCAAVCLRMRSEGDGVLVRLATFKLSKNIISNV